MRVTTNSQLIKRRSRIGMIASLAGIAALAGGMVTSIVRPTLIWVPLVALVIGFLLAQVGNYHLRRWGRSPRPDQVLEAALKGFDDRYHLYAWTLPVPFALIGPQGVYTLTTRDQKGQVSVNGSTWRTRFSIGQLFATFAQEGLGNPTAEAQGHAGRLHEWIAGQLPELKIDVQPIVVFTDERVQLQVTDPIVPVTEHRGLKKWLRGGGKGSGLKASELKALEELFDARSGRG